MNEIAFGKARWPINVDILSSKCFTIENLHKATPLKSGVSATGELEKGSLDGEIQ